MFYVYIESKTEYSFVGRDKAKMCSTREVCFKSHRSDPEKRERIGTGKTNKHGDRTMHTENRCTSQNLEETRNGERSHRGRPELQAKKGSGKDPNDEQRIRCRFYLWWG